MRSCCPLNRSPATLSSPLLKPPVHQIPQPRFNSTLTLPVTEIATSETDHRQQQTPSIDNHQSSIMARRRRRRQKRRKDAELWNEEPEHGIDRYRCSKSDLSQYLTRKQEAEFSICLKDAAMIESSSNGGRMQRMANDRAILRARECSERIVLSYKRLVVSIAAPYQGKGLGFQDLVQEGCIGLIKGSQRFDHRKGYKLSTYVYWWIKQEILKAVAHKSRLVRFPVSLSSKITKVAEATSQLRRRLGRSPSYEEVADFIEISASSVRILCERSRNPISIDQPVNHEAMTLKDVIPGPEETRPEVMVTRHLMLQNMEELLKGLSEREEYIIRLLYGLNGETIRSCGEIARLLSISRERVRQIHVIALTKLREDKSMIENFIESVV